MQKLTPRIWKHDYSLSCLCAGLGEVSVETSKLQHLTRRLPIPEDSRLQVMQQLVK